MKLITVFLIQFSIIQVIYSQIECNPEFLFMTIQELPQGLATDGNNFWVSGNNGMGNNSINIYDEFGNYIESINPDGVNISIDGIKIHMDTLWGVSEQLSRLYKMNKSTGNVYEIFDLPTNIPDDPNNFGVTHDGVNLYVVEYGVYYTSYIYKLNPVNGELLNTISVNLPFLLPVEINSGRMLGITTHLEQLFEINLDTGQYTYLTEWCLHFPRDIAFNTEGELFGIDGEIDYFSGTQSVYKIDGIDFNTNISILKDYTETNIYPNPTGEMLKIETSKIDNGTLTIINSLGEICLVDFFQNSYIEINVSTLKPSIYYLHLKNGSNNIIKKFIKL